ncbi:hypothetical protein CUC53_07345 [Aeromonas cavernicola]|uniref:Uncharacterized protein n=1 Tax=Aeromonas cavernicola TaxID=1006623 RepID=A0A2H9U5W6_9GAMM|nr:hypothetical protein CUC53_07345 [Aeromonas cavernicola]
MSEQQKTAIELAAKAANVSVPEYVRQALSVGKMDALKQQHHDTEQAIKALRDELASLSSKTTDTATTLAACLTEADSTAQRIRRRLDGDRLFVVCIAGGIGWLLALTAAMLGVYLMS